MPRVAIAIRNLSGQLECETCQNKVSDQRRTVKNIFDFRWPLLCEECYPDTPYFINPKRRISKFFRATHAKVRAIKNRAERDGIEINLMDSDITDLICQECHYCGEPAKVEKPNGIDRKDNDQGYIHGNVLPSCSTCNYAKGTNGYFAFLRKCREIAQKHPGS